MEFRGFPRNLEWIISCYFGKIRHRIPERTPVLVLNRNEFRKVVALPCSDVHRYFLIHVCPFPLSVSMFLSMSMFLSVLTSLFVSLSMPMRVSMCVFKNEHRHRHIHQQLSMHTEMDMDMEIEMK